MNFVDQIINKFKAKQPNFSGWITPDGEFKQVTMYDHFPLLRGIESFNELFTEFDEAHEQEKEDQYNWTADLGPDDHPAWHAYYSDAEDRMEELRQEILWKAYNDGWSRISMDKRFAGHIVEIEGVNTKRHNKDAKDLASIYECELHLTEVMIPQHMS